MKFYKIYQFKVSTDKKTFLKINHPIAYNVKEQNECITFNTTLKGYTKIKNSLPDDSNIRITNNFKKLFQNIIRNHLVITISLIVIFFIFISSGLFVREISFQNVHDFDYDVYKTVKAHIKKVGLFYTLDCKLNDLGHELRTSYPHFAYIGIQKVGAKLVIEIEKQEVPLIQNKDKNALGDIIASDDGYILGAEVSKGVLCVTTSQVVKKGELLISGNLDYKTNPTSRNHYIHPEGIVLAKVATYEKINVPKVKKEIQYNNQNDIYYAITFFNQTLKVGDEKNFDFGHQSISEIFSFSKFLGIHKVTSYGIGEVVITYNETEALSYAISKIKYDFTLNALDDDERLLSIDLISQNESSDDFNFCFLVKSIKNIGKFQKINLDS